MRRRLMQRRPAAMLGDIHISAVFDQDPHQFEGRILIPVGSRRIDRVDGHLVLGVDIRVRTLIHQTAKNLCPAEECSQSQRGETIRRDGVHSLGVCLRQYLDRVATVHLKDIGADGAFLELGEGTLDFPGILDVLSSKEDLDWLVVEQDTTTRTPAESIAMSRTYIREELGL